jgi:hypothetical protein
MRTVSLAFTTTFVLSLAGAIGCSPSTKNEEQYWTVHQTEIGLPSRINPYDGEQVAKMVAGIRGRRHFEDSLGVCIFTTRTRLENLVRAVNAHLPDDVVVKAAADVPQLLDTLSEPEIANLFAYLASDAPKKDERGHSCGDCGQYKNSEEKEEVAEGIHAVGTLPVRTASDCNIDADECESSNKSNYVSANDERDL